MSTTLKFWYRKDGVQTDVDSVVLRDHTANFGVRRADTLETVVAPGVAMTRMAAGDYRYTFDDPAPGLTYDWVAEYTVDGQTQWATFSKRGGMSSLSDLGLTVEGFSVSVTDA